MRIRIFVLLLTVMSQARAGEPGFDPVLSDGGSRVLRGEARADDFIAEARRIRHERPFTEDEKLFLVDLGEKLSPRDRERLCPDPTRGLCENGPEAPEKAVAFADDPLPPPEPEKNQWSSPWVWGAVAVLAVFAGASAMRGKELVIHRP